MLIATLKSNFRDVKKNIPAHCTGPSRSGGELPFSDPHQHIFRQEVNETLINNESFIRTLHLTVGLSRINSPECFYPFNDFGDEERKDKKTK